MKYKNNAESIHHKLHRPFHFYNLNKAILLNAVIIPICRKLLILSFDYSFNDNNLEPGVYSYRLKQIDFDGSFSYSNEIEVDINGVTDFALGQNYPNPFNPATVINYQLPVNGLVTLKVYDVLGKEVITLVNEEKPAGVYEVNFNAADFASGVYVYKLQAGDFVSSKKMILTK